MIGRLVIKYVYVYYTMKSASDVLMKLFFTKELSKNDNGPRKFNNLMLLHIHKDMTDRIDNIAIAREFVQINERRLNYFGTF